MRTIVKLDKKWAFSKEADSVPGKMPQNWYWVNLPHTWNAIDGQDGGNDYYRGTCYYAREIEKASLPKADRYYLELKGVNASADVIWNGEVLAHHDGGYSAWRVDVTDVVKDQNLLVIAVDNSANESIYPQMADFTFYGGLYREVELIAVSDSHFALEHYGDQGIKVTATVEGKITDRAIEEGNTSDKTNAAEEKNTAKEINAEKTKKVQTEGSRIEKVIKTAPARLDIALNLADIREGQKVRVKVFDGEGKLVAVKEHSISAAFLEKVEEEKKKSAPMQEAEEESKKAQPGEKTEQGCKKGEEQRVQSRSGKERQTEISISLELKEAHLWHGRKDPYLYSVVAELLAGNREGKEESCEVLDIISTHFGIRTFRIDAKEGFFLNEESYPLRGVSRHQDRWGLGNALTEKEHEEDMDLICEVGANTIRLAHYQHAQEFYDLCDERGMVVWAEIPYISRHMPTARENTVSQMKELVNQNYNHPSIVVWGLSNEITMSGASDEDLLENHRLLNDMVHAMDPGRKTVEACISMCDIHDPYVQIPDAVSYNHYFGWYGGDTSMNGPWLDHFHEEFPDTPIGVSEYGCEGLNWHSSSPTQGDYTEEYQAHYHEELIKQLYTRPYLWATHVWNMFDFGADGRNEGGENGQNHKGLVTFDRKYKKDAFYAYKAWLSCEPFVHICGKRYEKRVEPVTKVTVYSNQPKVELFVNGKSLGVKESPEHFFYFDVPNEGESVLTAVAGITVSNTFPDAFIPPVCRDESRLIKVDTFPEEYRLKENGALLNWFDITEKEGYLSLNSKIKEIAATEEGSSILKELMGQMMTFKNAKQKDEKKKAEEKGQESGLDMMKMLEGFTLLRLVNMSGVTGELLSKEKILALNEKLNNIPKTGRLA